MKKVEREKKIIQIRKTLEKQVTKVGFNLTYPVYALFKNEQKENETVLIKNLPELISTFDKQIFKGNYFESFLNKPPYDAAQEPRYDLLDCATEMYCYDCKRFFLIDGNCTCKVYCEHCKNDNIDFGIYCKHLKK